MQVGKSFVCSIRAWVNDLPVTIMYERDEEEFRGAASREGIFGSNPEKMSRTSKWRTAVDIHRRARQHRIVLTARVTLAQRQRM
jgi:hypothetical protein